MSWKGQDQTGHHRPFGQHKASLLLGLAGVTAASIVLAVLSSGRIYFTFGTETDYLARNIAEAIRLLKGIPLLVQFHPPFYSMVLAATKIILTDWFTIGLLISWISATSVLLISFLFFYQAVGPYAAWGSTIALMLSRLFVSQACLATQDMFFLAIYCLCFFLSLQAFRRASTILWILSGVAIGCAMITRSNALTLLILLLAPLLGQQKLWVKLRNGLACLLAFAMILICWMTYANQTGAPTSPSFGHVNLAMRYFPTEGDPFSVKARQELNAKFDGYLDVLIHDPTHILQQYAKDAWKTVRRSLLSSELIPFPLVIFGLVGTVILFSQWYTPFGLLFLVSTLAQIGLVNFKSYEPRFYLFLLPILGAGLGCLLHMVFTRTTKSWMRMAIWTLVILFILPHFRWTYKRAFARLHKQDQELGEAVDAIRHQIDTEKPFVIVGLKPHIPHYLGVDVFVEEGYAKLPEFKSKVALQQWLQGLTSKGIVYIYFGSYERRTRPHMSYLAQPNTAPEWLRPAIYGGAGKGWILYRFDSEYQS